MKTVCVVRNAEAQANSDIIRSIDAFTSIGMRPLILSRTRTTNSREKVIHKTIDHNGMTIDNYEIQLSAEMDRGVRNLTNLHTYQRMVKDWLLKNSSLYDAIHAYDLDTGMPAMAAAKKLGKKFVYHISDFYVDSRSGIPGPVKPLVRQIEYNVINGADDTIICLEERREQIKGSRPRKLHVIHNSPVDTIDLKGKGRSADLSINLTYIGGLINVRFIKEILEVVSKRKDFSLIIGGIGPMSELTEEYSRRYINIKYLGKVSYEDALNYYKDSDVMFAIYDPKVPNQKWSAPNKAYEAMMLGKPIIVARDSGIDTIVEREGFGFVTDYDKESFGRILDMIAKDPKLIRDKGLKAREAYTRYSWTAMKEIYKDIYSDMR